MEEFLRSFFIYISYIGNYISYIGNVIFLYFMAPKILSKFDFKMSRISRRKNQVIKDLNKYLQYHRQNVEILDVSSNFPNIQLNQEPYELPECLKKEVDKTREKVVYNEKQAIVQYDMPAFWDLQNVQVVDYATAKVLRESNKDKQPSSMIITAGAVLICAKKSTIILHKRSKKVETFGGCYHTLGGAYQPEVLLQGQLNISQDRDSLMFTVIREIFEECNVILSPSAFKNVPILASRETDTGFLQYYALGINLTEEEFKKIKCSNEGTKHLIDFANLEEELKKEDWTPSGKAHVLMWLGLHATGVRFGKLFNWKRPKKVFDNIVSS